MCFGAPSIFFRKANAKTRTTRAERPPSATSDCTGIFLAKRYIFACGWLVVAVMAAPSVRLWFRLEGAASAAFLDISSNTIVADLRDKIKEKLANKLKHVDADDLRLSTADGKTTYSRGSQPVSTIDATTEDAPLIVTGTFVRAARSPFAAAHGPRSSCGGRTWTRSRRSWYR